MRIISADDIQKAATWPIVIEGLRAGHRQARPDMGDTLVGAGAGKMLVRSAWIDGVAPGVKAVTVIPENPKRTPALPTVQGSIILFDDQDGQVTALLDGPEITRWKTAGDSALGADLLARHDMETMLMVGAGNMAAPLIRAHLSVRPSIQRIMIWNRTAATAAALVPTLADLDRDISAVTDLEAAIPQADLISTATMSPEPILKGALLKPGCHVDLVGAYTPEMREADDDLLRRGRLFVDCFATTVGEIGELIIPMQSGVIARSDVLADYYDLVTGTPGRQSDEDITVLKNGGGAHLDIMTASAIAAAMS